MEVIAILGRDVTPVAGNGGCGAGELRCVFNSIACGTSEMQGRTACTAAQAGPNTIYIYPAELPEYLIWRLTK